MLVISSIGTYCSLLHIRTYYVSLRFLILKAVLFIVIMLLKTYKNILCILTFLDSQSSTVYCDNAAKAIRCVADVIFGQ